LHWASQENYADIIVLLLLKGADNSIKTKDGKSWEDLGTPLLLSEVQRLLFEQANLTAKAYAILALAELETNTSIIITISGKKFYLHNDIYSVRCKSLPNLTINR